MQSLPSIDSPVATHTSTRSNLPLLIGQKKRSQRRQSQHGAPLTPTPNPSTNDTSGGPTYPDGGMRAWLNIVGCTLIAMTGFGQVTAFGVFQTYYAENMLATESSSTISWIGSVQILLLYISGLFLGRVFDTYGARVRRAILRFRAFVRC